MLEEKAWLQFLLFYLVLRSQLCAVRSSSSEPKSIIHVLMDFALLTVFIDLEDCPNTFGNIVYVLLVCRLLRYGIRLMMSQVYTAG